MWPAPGCSAGLASPCDLHHQPRIWWSVGGRQRIEDGDPNRLVQSSLAFVLVIVLTIDVMKRPALVFGRAVRVLPQLDVALHVHLLHHSVVGAAGQVLARAHLYSNGTIWWTSVGR